MKTLFKLLLVLVLCFAVLCERNLGFHVDSLGVAHQNNMAPYIKILMQNTSYLMNLQSIYEIYQDNTTNQWIKDFTTETKLDTLLWEIRADLLKGYVALLGKVCPCANPQPPEDVEPFPISRRMGRSVRAEPFDSCSIPNFGYLRLVFKQHVAENITDCSAATVDLAQCTTQCNEFCANSTNPTTCNAGCAAITSVDNIDTDTCYTACNATGTEDPDCINGCMNIVDCATESTCRLDIGYHLHNYQWVNSTTNAEALRKLVFAFEIVPQPEEGPACGSEVVTWIKGPFLLWINTTSLSLQHTDECVDCPIPGLESAVEVPSNLFFAPGETAVTGRLYVDQFESGLSIFNYPVDVVEVEEQPNPEPPIPATR